VRGQADEHAFRIARAPGCRRHSAEGDARVVDGAAAHVQRDRRRSERERVRRPVTDLDVRRARGERQRRDVHRGDQIARREDGFPIGMVAGCQVELREGNRPLAVGAVDPDDRVEGGERHAHVRRVCGDTVCAAAEHGMNAVVSLECRTAGSGLALVAGSGGVAEVITPRPLQQIAAGGRHVADLSRCAGENRL